MRIDQKLIGEAVLEGCYSIEKDVASVLESQTKQFFSWEITH